MSSASNRAHGSVRICLRMAPLPEWPREVGWGVGLIAARSVHDGPPEPACLGLVVLPIPVVGQLGCRSAAGGRAFPRPCGVVPDPQHGSVPRPSRRCCSATGTPDPEIETMKLMVGDATVPVTQPPWLSPHRPISSGVIAVRERRNSAAAISASRARSSSVSFARRPGGSADAGRVVAQDWAKPAAASRVEWTASSGASTPPRFHRRESAGVWAVPRWNRRDPTRSAPFEKTDLVSFPRRPGACSPPPPQPPAPQAPDAGSAAKMAPRRRAPAYADVASIVRQALKKSSAV